MDHLWHREFGSLDDILEAVVHAFPALDPHEQRVGIALYRRLAAGGPVGPSELEQVIGPADIAADQFLRRSSLRSLVEWDQTNTVIGFGGLTTRHSRHSLMVDDRRLSTWCAWDAMCIPELLGVTAVIESVCPQSGNPVRLRVNADRIERMNDLEPVLSFTVPARATHITSADQVILSFCSLVNLFESRLAGTTWISTRPGTFLLPVADAFALAQRHNTARYGRALHGEPSPPHERPASDVA